MDRKTVGLVWLPDRLARSGNHFRVKQVSIALTDFNGKYLVSSCSNFAKFGKGRYSWISLTHFLVTPGTVSN